jgi:hypothetical protein
METSAIGDKLKLLPWRRWMPGERVWLREVLSDTIICAAVELNEGRFDNTWACDVFTPGTLLKAPIGQGLMIPIDMNGIANIEDAFTRVDKFLVDLGYELIAERLANLY